MSSRKFPTMIVAYIEASRRNPQKSTGPRSERGLSPSPRNGRRHGDGFGDIVMRARRDGLICTEQSLNVIEK